MLKKTLALVTAFILSVATLLAGGADGRYHSRLTQDGMLYFINPQKISVTHGIKSFSYDITCLSWTDSATVNFTFVSPYMDIPQDLALQNGTKTVPCKSYSALYIDLKKKDYEIRITSKFPVADLEQFIASPAPPVFTFTQQGHQMSATYSPSAWRKDSKKLNDIFKLFNYTRK